MSEAEPTWIVLVRDVSSSVVVQDTPELFAGLVLDADTGLIRGVSLAASAHEACGEAARSALTASAGDLPPNPPVQIVFGESFDAEIRGTLAQTLPDSCAPTLIPNAEFPEAEDIFDSLLGYLAGRDQPADLPDPPDWDQLYTRAADYCRARPWLLWSDADHLELVVTIDDESRRYVAVVLGQQGVQRGLALYPGTALPDSLASWRPGQPVPVPEGSLVLWLDPPEEVPSEFAAKAARYGWPDDLDLDPVPAGVATDGLIDLDRRAAQTLTLALAAVIAHRRPRAVRSHPAQENQRATTGTVPLADGRVGEFTISN